MHKRKKRHGSGHFDRHARMGPPHGRGGRGGRHRARRGDIRGAVLRLLVESPMHGYQIIQELDERTGGVWHPSPGSVYPLLQQFTDEGLVTSESVDGRNVFSLTTSGRQTAEALEGPPPWERMSGPGMRDRRELHGAMRQLAGALRDVGQSGSDDQVAKAAEIIDDARRRLYALLSD